LAEFLQTAFADPTDGWRFQVCCASLRRSSCFAQKPLAGQPHPSPSNEQRAGFPIAYERGSWTL
jgi:hypothetical protein